MNVQAGRLRYGRVELLLDRSLQTSTCSLKAPRPRRHAVARERNPTLRWIFARVWLCCSAGVSPAYFYSPLCSHAGGRLRYGRVELLLDRASNLDLLPRIASASPPCGRAGEAALKTGAKVGAGVPTAPFGTRGTAHAMRASVQAIRRPRTGMAKMARRTQPSQRRNGAVGTPAPTDWPPPPRRSRGSATLTYAGSLPGFGSVVAQASRLHIFIACCAAVQAGRLRY